MLHLHQEFLLLAVDDEGKIEYTAGTSTFRLAFIGACITELSRLDRIDCDLEQVTVRDPSPPKDPALAQVMAMLAGEAEPKRLRYWLSKLQEVFQELINATLKGLCDLGVLQVQESHFLWVLSSRKYPVVDGTEKKEAKLRIMEALLGDGIPNQEDAILIGLARVGGLLEAFLSVKEIASLHDRINEISKLDLTTGLLERAILEEQEAIASAMLLGPYPV